MSPHKKTISRNHDKKCYYNTLLPLHWREMNKMLAESDKVNARYVQTEKSALFLELVQKLIQAKLPH